MTFAAARVMSGGATHTTSITPFQLLIRCDANRIIQYSSDNIFGIPIDAIQQLVHTRHPKNNRILVTFYRVALYTPNDTPDEPPNPFARSAAHSSVNMLTATMQPDGSLHTLYRLY
ncbi:hypothetical protein BDEG_27883 [Batrachochytrium dendrobatidis JEL423]|uniref:Uncharacterized protein n=1 Tax=Batrachochytrium dendrobatidis (strain JEL423) TaxID=403673 RepID=A0A177WYH9_BATDL|nr:hypothetical protein BDEG_27883 [Batrachochytrium dendrobatidis JEL423]